MKKFVWLQLLACQMMTACIGTHKNKFGADKNTLPSTLIRLPNGWSYSGLYSIHLPNGIQVFTFDSIFAGRKTKAVCVAYDSKLGNIEFKPILAPVPKKPSEFFAQENGKVYACINGGFFGSGKSYSLVKYNNSVASPNIKMLKRPYQGNNIPYYPTRASFGVDSIGNPSVAWVYAIGNGNVDMYSYPSPSPNVLGSLPQPTPAADFPANGAIWNPINAIGGSPMLLKDGKLVVSDAAELINIDNSTSRARSAIGYTSNKIVLIVAIEGGETAEKSIGHAGLNLMELAYLLKTLSCTNAINLDGGGSTSLVISNQLTVKPGDHGIERSVASAVLIKKK